MLNILNIVEEHQQVISQLHQLEPKIKHIAKKVVAALQAGGKIFWMGNGGSAADSQHLAAELIGRFTKERRAIPAIALSTDTSILTCLSNDYDYSIVFSRQLEALCSSKDVVVGLSTSGNSPNILKGIATAQHIGAFTIGLTGHDGGQLVSLAHECLVIPSKNTARIQEAHILIGHILCEWVEEEMFQMQTRAFNHITELMDA